MKNDIITKQIDEHDKKPYLNHLLLEKIDLASNKIVSCGGCTKCCEKGLVYVVPEEKSRLESIDVPLIEIEGVHFIKRKKDGSCSMLDKEKRICTIYEDRPIGCKLFPLDVFSRNGQLEWSIYTYCPPERLLPVTMKNGKVKLDYEVISYLTSSMEPHLTEDVLNFFEIEDKVAAEIEILDEHIDDYKILGPVLGT